MWKNILYVEQKPKAQLPQSFYMFWFNFLWCLESQHVQGVAWIQPWSDWHFHFNFLQKHPPICECVNEFTRQTWRRRLAIPVRIICIQSYLQVTPVVNFPLEKNLECCVLFLALQKGHLFRGLHWSANGPWWLNSVGT